MSVMERRLQLLLDRQRYALVEREARASGRSVAAVIREAIDVRFADDVTLRQAAARAVREALVLHPFDASVVSAMVDLVETSRVGGRDAVHAATALAAGFGEIVSTDPDVDVVPGLCRLASEEWGL